MRIDEAATFLQFGVKQRQILSGEWRIFFVRCGLVPARSGKRPARAENQDRDTRLVYFCCENIAENSISHGACARSQSKICGPEGAGNTPRDSNRAEYFVMEEFEVINQ
jgi:hypothetical protein